MAAQVAGNRFKDNLDGTVTDHETGLVWEKKTVDSMVHDTGNAYQWSNSSGSAVPDGTVFTTFLAALNDCASSTGVSTDSPGFAGHCDWRLPTIEELRTIVDLAAAGCGSGSACINAIFGPTQAADYWSSTSDAASPTFVWAVPFDSGGVSDNYGKGSANYVRAVRAGS